MADITEQYQYQLATDRVRYQRIQEAQALQEQEKNEQKTARMGWGIFLSALILSLVADVAEISVIAAPLVLVIDVILGFMLGFSKGAKKQWKKWIAGFLPIPLVRAFLLIWAFASSRSAILQQVGKFTSLGQAKKSSAA